VEKDRNITASLLLIYILIFSNFASAQKKEYAIPEEQKKFSVSLFGGGIFSTVLVAYRAIFLLNTT
jgi:hypothetical protein